jgi:CheY-like chemotaxis protein
VDDEASLRELVRVVLGGSYRFVEAEDGEQALEVARSDRPDLIVLDVMLPRLNGLEVLAELRRDEELSTIPVVIVTAWSHAQSLAVSSGADHFVSKPFDPDDLKRPVEELLSR